MNDQYDDADLWVVWGGYNDQNSEIGNITSKSKYTVYGALINIVEHLQSKDNMPSIIFITQAKNIRSNEHMENVCKAMIEVGGFYGIPVYDLYTLSGISMINLSTLTLDKLHLNELGKNMVYPKICKFIENNA